MKKIKKPVSILLSLIMVFSLFTIVPLSASAAVGDVLSEDDYLTFTAEEAGSTVTMNVLSGSNLQYNKNNSGWQSYTVGTQIALSNEGDSVRFRGKDTTFNYSNHVSIGGKVACSGNVMSLRLDDDGKVQGLINNCFYSMFEACTGLTSAPELPETELADSCYNRMFYGCENLTKAPALPATTLAQNCYFRMFYGCKSLTKAPALPATTLAQNCYNNMFSGCESLTELPALPATTLAERCYRYMFYGCSKICISDEAGTFGDITYSAEYRIPTTGEGTWAYDALYGMFNGTGGKFTGTPDINTTYYVPAPAPETFKAYVKKLTGGTYTIENLTGETTVAQLKEIIADQIDIPATAQRLIFAGKELDDAKTLAEYNIGNESTIHLVIRGYTVTWLNYDNSELGTTTVQYGATPSYDGETPVRPEDMNNTYTFAAWDDGKTTYLIGEELPPVTGDVTYTAVFNGNAKHQSGYYVVGTMTNWKINDNYLLTKNEAAQGNEYMLQGAELNSGAEFKVVQYEAGQDWVWYPGSNNYSVNVGGTYDVYFRPDGDGGEDWYEHVIFALNVSKYTVTWKNWNGTVLETDENVLIGSTPTYDGETPVRPEDMNNTYTFAAWDDGKTTYLVGIDDLPPVTGDVTYTAVYTGETKPLFAGHSVTLGGDIGVNYFIDGNVAGVANAQTAVVKFAWDGGKYIQEVNLKKLTPNADGIYKVTINVAAAQMAHSIEAVAYIDGEMIYTVDLFSVQEYAETVYYDADQPKQLRTLAKALLNYGSEAQTVFADALKVKPERADTNVGQTDYSNVTADAVAAAINGEASDLAAVAPEFGAKFYTFSLLYLSQNTLRIYFNEDGDKFDPEAFDGSNKNYYYVAKTDIPAAELDELQNFEVSGVPFTFSALDYVKAVIGSSSMTEEQKNLAKSLFLYNQAANAYFDDPAPAGNTVDLSALEGDKELQNGDVVTGELGGDYKITIAAGATVTLKDVTITCLTEDAKFAGITPLGDATILLEGENTVKGGFADYPGIFVPEDTTLTIDGTGSLAASSGGDGYENGCSIGSGLEMPSGNIVINGGNITATGGAAGIGSASYASCGTITINGGIVNATGEDGAGIGSGNYGSCSDITITGGTITAIGGNGCAGIGSSYYGSCGNITIAATVTQVIATKGSVTVNAGIGAGYKGSCGTVTIAPGANVIQN